MGKLLEFKKRPEPTIEAPNETVVSDTGHEVPTAVEEVVGLLKGMFTAEDLISLKAELDAIAAEEEVGKEIPPLEV